MCIALLFGAAGVTAYIAGDTGPAPESKLVTPVHNAASEPKGKKIRPEVTVANRQTANLVQREIGKNSSTEPVYYCGALTKKGTPCTRRVKSKGRCWQHAGQ